jgi:DNA topoisomerase-1
MSRVKPILVLVESQTKCAKIEQYLGQGYRVVATFGHIMKLKSLENINIENNFECNYELIDEKIRHIELLRQHINNSNEIILACDNDREGEAICASICRFFNLSTETTKRIIFTEITEPAIQHAIKNPTRINANLVNAQQAREVLDILVGFTVSPILWKNISKHHKTSLSAGRCQTPALRLVYDNYLDIKNSSTQLIHNVFGIFTNLNLKFELNKNFSNDFDLEDFLTSCQCFTNFEYKGSKIVRTTHKSPEPLTTSRLQQVASNLLNMPPKDTMKYAQELYENGLITYMRTDCKKYSEEFIQLLRRYITSTYSCDYLAENLNEYIKPMNSEDPHEAIRPVNISMTIEKANNGSNISEKAKKIYEIIWNTSVQSCMANSIYDIITYIIEAPMNTEFQYKIEDKLFAGWEIVNMDTNTATTTNNVKNYMNNLILNIPMKYKKIETRFTLIGGKSHLTEASLVNLLEQMGIGRPSTFASLVDKIQFRKYVEKMNIKGTQVDAFEYNLQAQAQTQTQAQVTQFTKQQVSKVIGNEKNKLVITQLGIIVIEFLISQMDELFDYEYTKKMENELDLIAGGNKVWQTLCQTCYDELTSITKNSMNVSTFSMRINDTHSLIIGKYGPVVKIVGKNGKINGFIKVKDNLDLEKLKNMDTITLDDVVENKTATGQNEPIGKYKNQDLYIKKGKYGVYAQWGNEKKSLGDEFGNDVSNIKYIDVLLFLEKDDMLDPNKPVNFVRELTNNISIRNGKFGDYIYYKKAKNKNPTFLSLKGFEENHRTCDKQILLNWLKINCGIKI